MVRGPTLFRRGVLHHAELMKGDPVIVTREPNNPKDSNAIVVSDMEEHPVGYVHREAAMVVAPWMDKGWLYTAKVIQAAERRFNHPRKLVMPDTLLIRLTPILPAKKATDISTFTSLLNGSDATTKELEKT